MPLYGPPGGMPTGWGSPPPPKSRTGLLVGLIATLLVVVIVGTLAAVLLLKPGGGTSAVATATATPTATLAPTTTPTSGPQVLLQDPLTSNANGWANDSHCFFKSDGYHVNDSYICFAPVGPLLNTAVSVKTRQISGSIGEFYGLMVRGKSQGNYYIFGIDSNGKWVFFKVVNDKVTDILPFAPHVAIHKGLGAANTLEAHALGSHFDFFVNGAQVGQADDATFASGITGVAGASGSEIVFRDFTLSSLS